MLIIFLLFALPGVALALAGERRGRRTIVLLGKGVASTGFVVLASSLAAGVPSPYAGWILAALGLSFAGDLILVSRKGFLAGLFAFLLAHLAYVGAFASRLSLEDWPIAIGVAILLLSLGILALLWRRLGSMKAVVSVYVVAITLMLWGGFSAWWASSIPGTSNVALAAVLFYVSDLFVARQVFVRRSFLNPALGLPLYYVAQYLFASTIGR